METLEDRLALSWAGVAPAAISIPGSSQPIAFNSQGDAAGSASIRKSEVDYYRFTAPTSGSYRFAVATPASNLDSILGVFDGNGQRIAYNDDISATNTDSEVSINLQAGARYYFGITKYTGGPRGAYTWLVDGPAAVAPPPSSDDAYEENDSLAAARDLGTLSGTLVLSGLKMRDGEDWFRFTQSGPGGSSDYISISFSHAEGDLDLYIHNSAGAVVGQASGVASVEQVSLNGLGSGTYFVRIHGFNGAQSSNYTLTIDPGAGSVPPPPPPSSGNFQIVLSLSGFTSSQAAIFNQAADRWEQVITGDLPNATYYGVTVDDLLIDGRSTPIDGRGGILGQAGPDRLRSGTYLPYHGGMEFDSADVADLEARGQLFSVIVHEMGHVLGIGTIWDNLRLITGEGGTNPRFIGAQSTAAYNQIFGRSESSVPVENTGGAGTRDGHWRESVFGNEIMTGWINSGSDPISRITVGALADMGYTVNMNAANAYSPSGTSSLQSGSSSGSGSSVMAGGHSHSSVGAHSHSSDSAGGWRDLASVLNRSHSDQRRHWWAAVDAAFASYSG